MAVITKNMSIKMKADVDLANITSEIQDAVSKSRLENGIVTIFIPGATGAVSTTEYEPGLLKDIPKALERIAPSDIDYEHHKTWGCDNGKSHIRATFIGPSLVVPFTNGKLTLGTWQQITVMNFDTRARQREIVIQIIGEK